MYARQAHLKALIARFGESELEQLIELDDDANLPSSLIEDRFVVVETGRDAQRLWYNPHETLAEALRMIATRATDDEWGFAVLHDLDTGQDLGVTVIATASAHDIEAQAGAYVASLSSIWANGT